MKRLFHLNNPPFANRPETRYTVPMNAKWMIPIYCGLVLLLAALGALLSGAGFLPPAYYTAMEEASVLDFSNAEWIALPAEEPSTGAVSVLLDGISVCTVADANTAARVLNARLTAYGTAPEGETLVSVRFARDITLSPAGAEGGLGEEDFAALLDENPALCAVEQVTRRAEESPVPYETATAEEEDERLPKGARVVDGGSPGVRLTVTETLRINGSEVERRVVEDGEKQAPVPRVVTEGDYESSRPDREPGRSEGEDGPEISFTLADPIEKGDIESNFGTREGRMHYGLDYECEPGTPVLAPAAGTVIYAGERGAYGGVVDIDHGDGFVTRLARLSDIAVKAGEKVEVGRQIALVMEPETADVEPRLHMETIIGGIPYNPRQYLD